MLRSLQKFEKSEVAKERQRIIGFYDQYGEKATKEAFGVDRKLISRWKLRLKAQGGRVQALVPHSTRPKRLRQMQVHPRVLAWIRAEREIHPRVGKEKLKPDLDLFCEQERLPKMSSSTIGKVIKRNNLFFQKTERTYHNPNSGFACNQKKKRLRMRYSPKPTEYGHILSDTVERITDGVRDYFISAIDAKMKFALTLRYKRLTAANMLDFYERFKSLYPETVRVWQSDNGSENLGVFEQQLKADNIPHYFIYPRCPKIDAFIERYNRTVQEEFIDFNLDSIHDHHAFGELLTEWNVYYNTKRRHHSLRLRSPLEAFVEDTGMSHMCVTYTCD